MLVTGASGFLGRHLVGPPVTAEWTVIAPTSTSFDVRRRDATVAAVRELRPDVVVHLAYRKGDRTAIVDGSANVAEAAQAAGAHLVHLSTDLVFGGRPLPYSESDAPAPVIGYGVDKADAERAVATRCPDAVIVRTSLLYGTEQPSPAQDRLAAFARDPSGRDAMAYFTDEVRCPTHAGDVARAVVALAARPDIGGPLHIAGAEPISRAALAALMLRHLGAPDVALPTSTIAESGLVRPGNVVLDVSRATGLGIGCRPVSAVLGPLPGD